MATSTAAAAAAAAVAFVGTQVDELFVLSLMFARALSNHARQSTSDVIVGYALSCVVIIGASGIGATASALPPSADRYIRLLGLLPLFIGLHTLVKRARRRCCPKKVQSSESKATAVNTQPGEHIDTVEPLLIDVNDAGNDDAKNDAATPHGEQDSPPPPRGLAARVIAATALCLRPGVAECFALLLAAGSEEIAAFFPLFATNNGAAAATTATLLPVLSAAWLLLAWALSRAPGVAAVTEKWGEAAEPWLLIAVAAYCLVGSWIIPVTAPWQ